MDIQDIQDFLALRQMRMTRTLHQTHPEPLKKRSLGLPRSFIKSEILSGLEPEIVGPCGLDPLVPRPTNGEGWESM